MNTAAYSPITFGTVIAANFFDRRGSNRWMTRPPVNQLNPDIKQTALNGDLDDSQMKALYDMRPALHARNVEFRSSDIWEHGWGCMMVAYAEIAEAVDDSAINTADWTKLRFDGHDFVEEASWLRVSHAAELLLLSDGTMYVKGVNAVLKPVTASPAAVVEA